MFRTRNKWKIKDTKTGFTQNIFYTIYILRNIYFRSAFYIYFWLKVWVSMYNHRVYTGDQSLWDLRLVQWPDVLIVIPAAIPGAKRCYRSYPGSNPTPVSDLPHRLLLINEVTSCQKFHVKISLRKHSQSPSGKVKVSLKMLLWDDWIQRVESESISCIKPIHISP